MWNVKKENEGFLARVTVTRAEPNETCDSKQGLQVTIRRLPERKCDGASRRPRVNYSIPVIGLN